MKDAQVLAAWMIIQSTTDSKFLNRHDTAFLKEVYKNLENSLNLNNQAVSDLPSLLYQSTL